MKKRILCFGMAVLWIFGLLSILGLGTADSFGPEITDVYHIPKYPQYNDTISVFATIIDSDGVGNLGDEDDDGDGLSDIEEGEMGTDPLKKGHRW
jgi:hypothetical protein